MTKQINVGTSIRLFETDITAGRAVAAVSRRTDSSGHVNAALIDLLWTF